MTPPKPGSIRDWSSQPGIEADDGPGQPDTFRRDYHPGLRANTSTREDANPQSRSHLEFDAEFLSAAFANIPSIQTLAILRELVCRKTKASVLRVDSLANQPNEEMENHAKKLSGRYILKIDEKAYEWNEPTEVDRHRKATEWDTTGPFARKHIPKLQHSFEQGNLLLMVHDILSVLWPAVLCWHH